MIPHFPTEITLQVLELATASLVEEERRQPSPSLPLVNNLLRSASLVSRTWRPLAQNLLLRNGLITIANIDRFLDQVGECKLELNTVRVGAGQAEDTVSGDDYATPNGEGEALGRLLGAIAPLDTLECVGGGLNWSGFPVSPDKTVKTIRLVNQPGNLQAYTREYAELAPERLVVHHSPITPISVDSSGVSRSSIPLLRRNDVYVMSDGWDAMAARGLRHLDLQVSEHGMIAYSVMLATPLYTLKESLMSLSLGTFAHGGQHSFKTAVSKTLRTRGSVFANLTSLAIHLAHLSREPGEHLPPNITSLKILPNPPTVPNDDLDEAQDCIISAVDPLASLTKLAVPVCWVGSKLKAYCISRDVALNVATD